MHFHREGHVNGTAHGAGGEVQHVGHEAGGAPPL
jgi:hypothetical protein